MLRTSTITTIGYSFKHDGTTRIRRTTSPALRDFYNAVQAGNFPAVSFIKQPAYRDDDAGHSDPLDEQVVPWS